MHYTKRDVDDLEIWEIAAVLGCAAPDKDEDDERPAYRGNRPPALKGGIRKIAGNEELLLRQAAEARGG